jgi:hypothetical protein
MTLHDRIMRARQAQVEHEQKHDVQLPIIPFVEPEITWATENEVREHFHAEIDDEWSEYIHAHYDHEG